MSHQIGSILHGYRIEAEIGRGDASVVHRATWIARQRVVALKLISPRPPTGGADLARAVRAAEAARAIDHPNIVPVYEAGLADGVAFVSMRLIDGPSLAALLRAPGGMDRRRLEAILAQVGAALDHLASLGIVHGGVRPANILVGPGDHAYLTDVGMAPHARDPAADRAELAAIAAAAAAAPSPPPPPPPAPPAPPPPAPAGAPPIEGPRWRVPAIVAATLAALLVVIGVVAFATEGDGPRTVTTFVPADTPGAPGAPFPLGAVLPRALDGWRVIATDPASAERELHRLGRVETAHAGRGLATGVLVGVLPDRGDVRGALERVRAIIGGYPEGSARLPEVPTEARVQRDGHLVVVSFADGGRVIVVVAPERDTALALAAAAGRAVP